MAMTGKEKTRAIKHLLHQLAHGHRIEQHHDAEAGTLHFYLVAPPSRGPARPDGRSVSVPVEVICAARERGALKLWRAGGRLRQERKLTRRELRRQQARARRHAEMEEERRRGRKANPHFVDLYYRESPEHRWKPYFPGPLPAAHARRAWGEKNRLRLGKRTRHLQTVIISGRGNLRDPAIAGPELEKTAERYEQTGIL